MKVRYLYSGNVYQNDSEIEVINSPLEGELYVPNFKTKKYLCKRSAEKALHNELIRFLKKNKKSHGTYNLDVVLMKYQNGGYLFGERIITSFSY